MLSFILSLFPQAAGSPSVSPPRAVFEASFAPASVPPQPVCLALFCVTILVSMVLLPRSDLRFPLRRSLPLEQVRVAAASVYLGSHGCFMWWYPFCKGLRSVPLTHSHLKWPRGVVVSALTSHVRDAKFDIWPG